MAVQQHEAVERQLGDQNGELAERCVQWAWTCSSALKKNKEGSLINSEPRVLGGHLTVIFDTPVNC